MPGDVRLRADSRLKVVLRAETLADAHTWWRIADPAWADPLDPQFAGMQGGRWNPPRSFPTLYLNEDRVTARLNVRRFIADWPYEPEDLRDDTGPILVGVRLPRRQTVCDAHTRDGVTAAGLPLSYPLDENGDVVSHAVCQPIGALAEKSGLRGVRGKSAQSLDGTGRELAWFPATVRSRARPTTSLLYGNWYWN